MLRHWEKGELIWVAPGAVRYDAGDVEFLLPWLDDMREGAYPVEPTGGYIEGKRAGITSAAYYERACQVAAELDRRLAMTGTDRFLIEEYYCRDWPSNDYPDEMKFEAIGDMVNMDRYDVRRRIRSAFSYISGGPCPRWLDCIDCPDYEKCLARRYPPRKFDKQPVGISYRQWVRSRSRYHAAERR